MIAGKIAPNGRKGVKGKALVAPNISRQPSLRSHSKSETNQGVKRTDARAKRGKLDIKPMIEYLLVKRYETTNVLAPRKTQSHNMKNQIRIITTKQRKIQSQAILMVLERAGKRGEILLAQMKI